MGTLAVARDARLGNSADAIDPTPEKKGRGLRRAMGVFALALAMGGSGFLLKDRATTEAVLDWATFGNGRVVRAWASDLRAAVRGTPVN